MQFDVIFSLIHIQYTQIKHREMKIELCVSEVSQFQFSQSAWENTAKQSALCQPFVLLFNYHCLQQQLGRQCFGHPLIIPLKNIESLFSFIII